MTDGKAILDAEMGNSRNVNSSKRRNRCRNQGKGVKERRLP